MKRSLFTSLFLSLITTTALAESPYDKFSGKKNFTDKTTVKWVQAENVLAACNAERNKRGYKDFDIEIESCAVWDKTLFGDTCTIITPKTINYWSFGHELRHCFQGAFHKVY